MSSASRDDRRVPVAVLGATGYAGVELLRILARHPHVALAFLSSEQYRGKRASDVYPFLRGVVDAPLADPSTVAGAGCAIGFTALPHGAAAPHVRALLGAGGRVIDVSADFRLRDPAVHTRWYGDHPAPDLLREAVYGLPELGRDAIRGARLVANPGCYPTGALLGLAPLARAGLVRGPVIVDSKSGTTGAGRSAKVEQLFAEVNENFRPYAVGRHRHQPEIEQELRVAGGAGGIVFVPHLLPVNRGILSTMYVAMPDGRPDLDAIFGDAYSDEPFVVLRGSEPPELREVRGTNRASIGWFWDEAARQAIVVTAIDNLGKGAAGQAVQNMNLLLDLPETTALETPALVP
ncbi:MAG: N-acetyl-gamma-glutamyl-phosphate reductase [bacterium]|nr:N-acetyl-gamma-glutamyl-phosphate reductase [bacterium]